MDYYAPIIFKSRKELKDIYNKDKLLADKKEISKLADIRIEACDLEEELDLLNELAKATEKRLKELYKLLE